MASRNVLIWFSAKPSFANHKEYSKLYTTPYGIASCYNALPIGGGAFTLSRIVLSRLAERAKDSEHLIHDLLPIAVKELCDYIEKKITFLVEETHFFKSNFLVQEGFVSLEKFTGMFGLVGMNECVNILMAKEGKSGTYGHSEEADAMAKRILDKLTTCVESYESRFCDCTGHHFSLHAQVGIADDYSISPGVRIAIGDELPLHEHLLHCSQFHPYFKSGVGDIFPFDETAKRNPDAIVDLIKMLSPFVPHITEELWRGAIDENTSVHEQSWPEYSEEAMKVDNVEIVLQVNGKVRGRLTVPAAATKEELEKIALADANVQAHIGGATVRKVICVPGRLVNIVAK